MKTKVIETKLVPAGKVTAITLFGLVFTRDRKRITPDILNHELIHYQHQLELLYIPVFILYVLEWLYTSVKIPRLVGRHTLHTDTADICQNISYILPVSSAKVVRNGENDETPIKPLRDIKRLFGIFNWLDFRCFTGFEGGGNPGKYLYRERAICAASKRTPELSISSAHLKK